MPQTGARPGAHSEKDIVHVAKRVKPQHGWIDPAIDRNVGRTERGRRAGRRNGGRLCGKGASRQQGKQRQQRRAGENSCLEVTFTRTHIPHFITGLQGLDAGKFEAD